MVKAYKIGGNFQIKHVKGEVSGAVSETIDLDVFTNEEIDRDIRGTMIEDISSGCKYSKYGQDKINGRKQHFTSLKLPNKVTRILDNDRVLQFAVERNMALNEIYCTILKKANSKIFGAYKQLATPEQKLVLERAFKKRFGHKRLENSAFIDVQDELEKLIIGSIPVNGLSIAKKKMLEYMVEERESFRVAQSHYSPRNYIQAMIENGVHRRELHDGIVNICKSPIFDSYDASATIKTKEQVHRVWTARVRKKDIKGQSYRVTIKNLEDAVSYVMGDIL